MNVISKYILTFILLLSVSFIHGQCAPDTTAPSITCPGNISVACPHIIGNTFTFQTSIAPTTSDNCGAIVSQTYTLTGATNRTSPSTGINDATVETYLAGVTTVTYVIKDGANNSATCSFTVTVNDFTSPSVMCPPNRNLSNTPGFCYANVTQSELGFPNASDNCNGIATVPTGITLIDQPDPLPDYYQFPIGTTTVTWNVTDLAGNSTTCIQTVTVTDNESPMVNCPSDITVNAASGSCDAYVNIPTVTVTDNCGVSSITNNYNGGGASASDTFPIGTTTITFTATDTSNNVSNLCTINVTVINTQSPTLSLIGVNPLTVEACGNFSDPGATANDSCFGNITGSIVVDSSSLNLNSVGTYTIIYNVSNPSGIAASPITRTVHVVDTTAPTLSLIGPNPQIIGDCSTYTELGAMANDFCFGDISTNLVIDNSNVNTGVLGTYTVYYNVTDAHGNVAAQITRTVNVIDTSPPEINLIGDNPQLMEACSGYVELGATLIDPCSNINLSGSIVMDTSGVNFAVVGTYYVTYNAMDTNGNEAIEVIREITVVDATNPVIVCPNDILIGNDVGNCSAVVNFTPPSGTDSCSAVTTIQTDGLISGSVFPLGTTINSFLVTDASGNSAICSFTVTVNDVEAPIALCQNISVQLDPTTGLASISPSDVDAGTSDNCIFSLSLSQTDFNCSHIGTNVVTLFATDDAGNVSSCDTIVTVIDDAQNATVTIVASANPICQNQSVTFTAEPLNGGTGPTYQWLLNGITIAGQTASTYTTTTLNDVDIISVIMYPNSTFCAPEILSNTLTINVYDFNPPADAGPDVTNSICTNTTVALSANPVIGSGSSGLWSVTSGQTTGFSFSDATSPTSIFSGDVGETYLLTWSVDNPSPCNDSSDSMAVTFIGCSALDFDGIDDNITFRDNYNLNTSFSIEIWIKPEILSSNIQTIISKREAQNLIDGYDLRLVDNYISFQWNDGESIISPYPIIINRWCHVAITFDGSSYNLYIDGLEVANVSGIAPINNTSECIVGAMDQNLNPPFKPLHYFKGGMDELRLWNAALSPSQIKKMMNQEIQEDSGNVKGKSMPLEISGLAWTDLNGYYQMNQISDISSGNLIASNATSIAGILRYMTTLQSETAPLPYQTSADGLWTDSNTWLHGNVQAIPNSLGIDGSTLIDWNIVKTSHDVSSGPTNLTLAGLEVSANTLSIANPDPQDGQSLRVTDYIVLNGTLDLVGESQLLQDEGSVVDYMGIGKLERDQQGTSNLFNYNYWSSPVSSDGNTFTVGTVLKDGTTNSNPLDINWITSNNASGSTNPISLSNRWIYTYEDTPGADYFDWVYKGETNSIDVGLGFTMKGSGVGDPVLDLQNYVFAGQPNNGIISIPTIANYQALVGNPYPSALDANQFILENGPLGSNAIDGALYFWEHSTTNASHVLSEYEGGYATYNLSGGVPALSSPNEINGLGTANKIPKRYIPVAQGFYITANTTNGNVVFNNSQRKFIKEASGNSIFLRSSQQSAMSNEVTDENQIKRIRLNFRGSDGAQRPLLLAFTPNNEATEGVDYGYDAEHTETFPNDAAFIIDAKKYIIQGVGAFETSNQYPLGLFLSTSGTIEISLTQLENFESAIDVYVHDAVLQTSTLINNQNFQTVLNASDYHDRFFIVFEPVITLSGPSISSLDNAVINYLDASDELYIKLPDSMFAQEVQLFNLLGQQVMIWNTNELPKIDNIIRLPIKSISEGTYIVKVYTNTNFVINKKMIIHY